MLDLAAHAEARDGVELGIAAKGNKLSDEIGPLRGELDRDPRAEGDAEDGRRHEAREARGGRLKHNLKIIKRRGANTEVHIIGQKRRDDDEARTGEDAAKAIKARIVWSGEMKAWCDDEDAERRDGWLVEISVEDRDAGRVLADAFDEGAMTLERPLTDLPIAAPHASWIIPFARPRAEIADERTEGARTGDRFIHRSLPDDFWRLRSRFVPAHSARRLCWRPRSLLLLLFATHLHPRLHPHLHPHLHLRLHLHLGAAPS